MRALYVCAFLMDAATAALTVSRSPFGMLLHATPFQLGALGAAASLPYVFSTVLFGRLSDHVGRRRLVVAGVATILPLLAVMPAARTPLQFGALLALWSFMLGAYWPPMQAWIGDVRPDKATGRAAGLFNVGWSIGVLCGFLGGGLLFEVGPPWPFRLAVLFCAAIIGLVFLAPTGRPHAQRPEASPSPHPQGERHAAEWLVLSWIANAAAFFSFGAVCSLLPKLLADLPAGTGRWTWLAVTLAAVRTAGFAWVVVSPRPLSTPWVLVASLGAVAASMFLVWLTHVRLVLFMALGLLGGGMSLTYSWSLVQSLSRSEGRGRAASYHESLLRLGDLIGALVAGAVAQAFGLRAPYLVAGGVAVVATVGVAAAIRRGVNGWATGTGRRSARCAE